MKNLVLLRHAKAEPDAPTGRDFDRPLDPRGREEAREMGKAARQRGLRFDRVIASPAVRVRETLTLFAEGYGDAVEPLFEPRIYEAPREALLAIVAATDDDASSLLMIGHGPGLPSLALSLVAGGSGVGDMAAKFPTAALAEIALPIERWEDVGRASGELRIFLRPRDL